MLFGLSNNEGRIKVLSSEKDINVMMTQALSLAYGLERIVKSRDDNDEYEMGYFVLHIKEIKEQFKKQYGYDIVQRMLENKGATFNIDLPDIDEKGITPRKIWEEKTKNVKAGPMTKMTLVIVKIIEILIKALAETTDETETEIHMQIAKIYNDGVKRQIEKQQKKEETKNDEKEKQKKKLEEMKRQIEEMMKNL